MSNFRLSVGEIVKRANEGINKGGGQTLFFLDKFQLKNNNNKNKRAVGLFIACVSQTLDRMQSLFESEKKQEPTNRTLLHNYEKETSQFLFSLISNMKMKRF